MSHSAEAAVGTKDILAEENTEEREQVIELLKKAYWMEIETVMSYIANSVNPDGVRAQEIKKSLAQDITEELGHAQQFAARIKELYGVVPGSEDFSAEQSFLQPPGDQIDIVHVIKGVIEAEAGAIEHYSRIIEFCADTDPVTEDMVIAILRDEQGHMRQFEGFLREYEKEGSPSRPVPGTVPGTAVRTLSHSFRYLVTFRMAWPPSQNPGAVCISKWRWQPDALPVSPTLPTFSPGVDLVADLANVGFFCMWA